MAKYIVSGGKKLQGKVTVPGAKNAGFKLLIASLLAKTPSDITNIGLISEIDLARENIVSLGGEVDVITPHHFRVDPRGLCRWEISPENGAKSRSATMFIPALLHRFGKAVVPLPGGDKIGVRPLERHFDGLRQMGVSIHQANGAIQAKIAGEGRLKGTNYRFEKNTHTGTETVIMAAVLAVGLTILENAAEEPEVDNLIDFLNRMGGEIKRIGRTIRILGVERLTGASIEVIPDRNEAVVFGCLALGTKGDITVAKVNPRDLKTFLAKVRQVGGGVDVTGEAIRFYYQKGLRATDVQTAPHPGFMTDWQAVWTALMTQAAGESVIFETVFENRFGYVPSLREMGAKMELFNPEVSHPAEVYNFNLADDQPENKHAARVFGPTALVGKEVVIKDIRAGATMLLAGLMAKGETVIDDPLDQIKRGYEDLPGKLRLIGANIQVR